MVIARGGTVGVAVPVDEFDRSLERRVAVADEIVFVEADKIERPAHRQGRRFADPTVGDSMSVMASSSPALRRLRAAQIIAAASHPAVPPPTIVRFLIGSATAAPLLCCARYRSA